MIEITIVIVILGVMMAAALPTFNAMRQSTSQTSVKRTLETAVRTANWSFRDRADYSAADAIGLKSTTLSVLSSSTEAQGGNRVSVAISADKLTFYAAARTDTVSGRCYLIKQGPSGLAYASTTAGACTADAAVALAAGSWGTSW
jgi:type II secretory pathway pseudopilin PulG